MLSPCYAVLCALLQRSDFPTLIHERIDGFVECTRVLLAVTKPPSDPSSPSSAAAAANPLVDARSLFERRLASLFAVFACTNLAEVPLEGRTEGGMVLLRTALVSWAAGAEGSHILAQLEGREPAGTDVHTACATQGPPPRVSFIALPDSFDALCAKFTSAQCRKCGERPANPALCLVCGDFLCGGAYAACGSVDAFSLC